jgi:hypothetical protein
MKFNLIFYLFTFLLPNLGLAQDWVFQVITANRNVYLNGQRAIDYDRLSVGAKLTPNQVLNLKNNNYFCLLHKSGNLLEISIAPGLYTISTIEDKILKLIEKSPNEK